MHYLYNEKLIEKKKKPQEIHLLGIFKRIFLVGMFLIFTQRSPQISQRKLQHLWANFHPRPESCLHTPPGRPELTSTGTFIEGSSKMNAPGD